MIKEFKLEIKRVFSRKIYSVILVAIPLFIILFLATIFGKGDIEEVPVGAVDYTGSILSGRVLDNADASPTICLKESYTNEDEAIKAMQKFDIYGFIVIPPNFDKELYSGKKPELTYYYHKSLLAVGEEVNGAILSVLADFSTNLVDESGAMGGLDKESIKAVAMPVNVSASPIYNSNLNFTTYITFPFVFIFLQILLIVLTVYVIGNNNKSNGKTCHCVMDRGIGPTVGKLLPYMLLFGVYALVTVLTCFELLDIPSKGRILPLAIAGIMLYIATMGVGVAISAFVPNFSIAISIASMYGALGATTSGVTFPIEQMGLWVEVLAEFFPIRHFIKLYHNIVYLGLPIWQSWYEFMQLLIFCSLILIVPFCKKWYNQRFSPPAWSTKFSNLPITYGVILIVVGGTVGYGMLYNLLYISNKVKEVPVAVTDECNTPLSRKYISYLDATEGVKVIYQGPDHTVAADLIKSERARGLIFIPADFEKRVATSTQAVTILEGSTTSFLYYLALQESCVAVMQNINDEYRTDVVENLPLEGKLAIAKAPQFTINGVALANEKGGYATFLIPIFFIVALFQTMVMAMGVWCGARHSYAAKGEIGYSDTPQKAGKTILSFAGIYVIISIFLLGLVPQIFNMPYSGEIWEIFTFAALFLFATAVSAYFLATFFTDSESVNLVVPVFSVGLIFLSGMSFPRECMPWIWQMGYYIFPCCPAITGYIKLNCLEASLTVVMPEILVLVFQMLVYSLLVYFVLKLKRERYQIF